MAIDSLTLQEYHNICSWNLSRFRFISISTSKAVNLGGIVSFSLSHLIGDPVEIAFLRNTEVFHRYGSRNRGWESSGGAKGEVMKDGWTRYSTLFFDCSAALIVLTLKFQVRQRVEQQYPTIFGLPVLRLLAQSSEPHFPLSPDRVQF
jgi:hypothetical protein